MQMHVPNFNSHQSTWSTTPVQVPHPKGKPPGAVAVSGLDSELDAERQNLLQTSPQLVGYAAKFALMSNIFKYVAGVPHTSNLVWLVGNVWSGEGNRGFPEVGLLGPCHVVLVGNGALL